MLQQFREAWSQYDPYATGYIPADCLHDLLLRVDQPLGPVRTLSWARCTLLEHALTNVVEPLASRLLIPSAG